MKAKARLVVVAMVVVVGMAQMQPAAGETTFTNPSAITIPAMGALVPAPWVANPYPSNIVASGLSGTITDVNVILHGFDCSATTIDFAYPEDIDIMLQSPTSTGIPRLREPEDQVGTNLVVLSDVGGDNSPTALQFSDLTLTLDDEAADPLPADTQLTAGTYRPTDDDDDADEQVPVDSFPPPAVPPGTNTALSAFDGTDPNGAWSLYMVDDWASPDICSILRGWTLVISTTADTTTTTQSTTTTTEATTTTTEATTTTTEATTTTTVPTTTTTVKGKKNTTTTAPTTTTTVDGTTTTTVRGKKPPR